MILFYFLIKNLKVSQITTINTHFLPHLFTYLDPKIAPLA